MNIRFTKKMVQTRGLNQRNKTRLQKMIILGVVLVMAGGIILPANPARAQWTEINQFLQNLFDIPFRIYQKIDAVYKKGMDKLEAVGFKDAARQMVRNIAIDSATFIVTGDKGQAPMFQTSFADYIQKEGDAYLGDALNNKLKNKWGVDFCEPLDPLVKVRLQITAKELIRGKKPACTFTKMMKNVRDFRKLKLVDLPKVADMFNPASNDLGVLLTATGQIQEEQRKKMDLAKLELAAYNGWKSVKSKVSGKTLTPPDFLRKISVDLPIDISVNEKLLYTGELAADFIGPFTNTLLSKYMKEIKKGLAKDTPSGSGSDGYGPSFSSLSGSNIQAARERFADLAEVNYSVGGRLDVLGLLSCENTESQYSCSINDDLAKALSREPHITVDSAIKGGLLNNEWSVGYEVKGKSGGTDIISKSIYSARTLAVLRKYRIIPVGWELAAEYYKKYDRSGEALTLKILTEEYDNPDSPYYKLVDPNWVLKIPDTICDKEGAGEIRSKEVITQWKDKNGDTKQDAGEMIEIPIRLPYCADERSCIKEGEQGCEYYGYCTKEKPIWKIESQNGECSPIFNSCEAYTKRVDKSQVGYLTNTLYGLGRGSGDVECGADDVGCREYCTEVDLTTGNWSCEPTAANPTDRIFLNNKEASDKTCGEDQWGCSDFVRMSSNLPNPGNWIPNSSFELFTGGEAGNGADFQEENHATDFATLICTGDCTYSLDDKNSGQYAINLPSSSLNGTINVGTALDGKKFILTVSYKGLVNLNLSGESFDAPAATNWSSASMAHIYGANSGTTITFSIGDRTGSNTTIDDIKLAEVKREVANVAYSDYGANPVKLKKAPDYLGCEGYTTIIGATSSTTCESVALQFWRDDIGKCVESGAENCRDFALHCSANEADCKIYKPVSYEGPSVPGVISASDQCPSQCVGYKSYQEQESFLDENTRIVNLIPTSGKTCPAADNGCEEFTNMSEGAEGEKIQYYSAIRACILPENGGVANYYTWASTAESGNQLKSWQLLEGLGGAPCTNTVTDADGTVRCTDTAETIADCTVGSDIADENPIYNPDCVEFIAKDGSSHWRKYSRIVPVDEDDCMPMRRTYNQGIYMVSPSKSKKCAASSVGCREYKGSGANNVKIVLNDDFERPVNNNASQGWLGGQPRTESLVANGRSLAASTSISKNVTGVIHQGRSYKLSFWAKSTNPSSGLGIISIHFFDQVNMQMTPFNIPKSIVLGDWNYYVVNLNNLNRAVSTNESLLIAAGINYYIDNIILTETQDDVYLIKDSWKTPTSCDQTLDGQALPGAMIGCEQYKDIANKDWYLKSFTRLCRDEVVGCEAMIDIQNTTEPFGQEFNNPTDDIDDRDDVVVPADALVYMVYDENKKCTEVGCTMLGRIEPTRDATADLSFTKKMMIVNPDKFGEQGSALCRADKLWCEEFTTIDGGGARYFKDPNAFTCEYTSGDSGKGWYQSGDKKNGCPIMGTAPRWLLATDSAHCVGGRSIDNAEIETNFCAEATECADYDTLGQRGYCSYWVGLCPIEEDNCSEYQDPTNPAGCDKQSVNGETFNPPENSGPSCDFYYYKSDKVSSEGCTEIDPKAGCRGFHETGGAENTMFATKRCSNDLSRECEVDADCDSGQCVSGQATSN